MKDVVYTFEISAAAQPRLLSRVTQIFDQLQFPVEQLHLVVSGDSIELSVDSTCEQQYVDRIKAKLLHVFGVQAVEVRGNVRSRT